MRKDISNLLQAEETPVEGIDLVMPRKGMVLSEAKIKFFLSKLYEENLIDTETYILAQKMAKGDIYGVK